MNIIIILVITFIIIWIFQGTKGVNYMVQLKKILSQDYGWSKDDIDEMWDYHRDTLNRMKLDGKSVREIARYVNENLNV